MKKWRQIVALWFITGAFYYVVESLWHVVAGGGTNPVMLLIGGISGILSGILFQSKAISGLKIIFKTAISLIIFGALLFITGFFGIAPLIIWLLLVPFGIWFENSVIYEAFKEGEYYGVMRNYINLVTYK